MTQLNGIRIIMLRAVNAAANSGGDFSVKITTLYFKV